MDQDQQQVSGGTTSIFQDVKQWAAQPFKVDMSVTGWFLFFGLIIAISVGWQLVFRHIEEGLKEV